MKSSLRRFTLRAARGLAECQEAQTEATEYLRAYYLAETHKQSPRVSRDLAAIMEDLRLIESERR